MQPNILFIVIDSLRADRIYGNNKVSTIPNIDYLIQKGVYFTNAITTNQYTAQVMQSIFSSRLPLENIKKKVYQKSDSISSPVSLLKNSGFNIFATLQEDIILHGFTETFDNDDMTFASQTNLYNGLGEKILQKLDSFSKPWFYYIHLSDLHKPCEVPEKLQHLNLVERYEQNLSEVDSFIGKILNKINLDETLIVITSDHGDYISSVSGARGELLENKVKIKNFVKKFIPNLFLIKVHLKKQQIIEKINTFKVETPHEKRNIDTHKMVLNKNLFDDIIHVPLIFSGYKINPISPITQQICNIDIFQTVLDLIGLPTTELKLDGRSLMPLLHGKKFDSIPIYLTSLAVMKKLFLNIKMDKSLEPLVGVRTENFKYFRNFNNSKKDVHLYDLKTDPFEDDNLFVQRTDIIQEMELILEQIQNNSLSLLNEDEDEDFKDEELNEVRESLKKLGYI